MLRFTIAALTPFPLLWAAALFGGWACLVAPLYITLIVLALDEGVTRPPYFVTEDVIAQADHLSVLLGIAHFLTLGLTVSALAGGWLGLPEKIGLFIGAAQYFGQVSNSNAHELIHRSSRGLHALGKWIFISLLFGHHASAHPLVHHRYVATDKDPNSARLGESFYHFAPRAWIGSFREGFKAETERRTRAGKSRFGHPYISYFGGAALFLMIAYAIAGAAGVFGYVLLAGNAQMQLLLSDYVQHYGLRRSETDSKPEPVSPAHSWNAPHWYSSALMLNAPRHSDHHSHPGKHFPLLTLDGPLLPRSLPAMAAIALVPSLWRRVMDPRVHRIAAGGAR